MSEFLKNTAGQHAMFTATLVATGLPATTGVTVTVSGDGGAPAASGGTLTNRGSGVYDYIPTQAETNFELLSLHVGGATVNAYSKDIYTTTKRVSALNDITAAQVWAAVLETQGTVAAEKMMRAIYAVLLGPDPDAGGGVTNYQNPDGTPGTRVAVTYAGGRRTASDTSGSN